MFFLRDYLFIVFFLGYVKLKFDIDYFICFMFLIGLRQAVTESIASIRQAMFVTVYVSSIYYRLHLLLKKMYDTLDLLSVNFMFEHMKL